MATVYPFRPQAPPPGGAIAGHGPSRFLDQPFSAPHYAAPGFTFNLQHGFHSEGLESRLQQFEASARGKLCRAIEDIPEMKLEDWFIRQLENEILPALARIGFDESFGRILFQTAAASWQRMGPLSNKCIWFNPDLIRNLKSVRGEMISKAESKSDTPWIVLPRVYHFLEEAQSPYLMCYLHYLASEPASEFRRILTRIIIEFVGNYALKYRSRMLPGCRMDAAIFYGYAAMFWKNLRNPPPGFEDDLIFNHCLRWIKLFRSRCADPGHDTAQSISQMETHRQTVMLTGDALNVADDGSENQEFGGLLVTLRHGRPGMAAAIDFMANWLCSCGKDAAGRSLPALLPASMNRFLLIIKRKFPTQSPEVQNLLRTFLHGLKKNVASSGADEIGNPNASPEQFRFALRRVLGMVEGTTASLA